MKVNFILKGKNNPTNIICRFKPTQTDDFSCTTGLWINRDNWNIKTQSLKHNKANAYEKIVNTSIKKLEIKIVEQWCLDSLERKNISKDWLKNIIEQTLGNKPTKEEHKIYFVEWIKKFIEESPKRLIKGEQVKERTVKHYKTTLNKIIDFESLERSKIRIENINLKFYRDFIYYCRNTENLNNNTIGGYITNIKMWCKNMEIEGLPVSPEYKHSEFASISNKTIDTYLNEEEINKVFNHNFIDSERLENTRDLFIIGLRTGLRISDFMRLKELNIKNDSIEIETEKTKTKVIIPLHQQVKDILNKRKGQLPKNISDQKFNLYVKEVCKIAGIENVIEGAKINTTTKRKEQGFYPKYELISSHTCRRSFATNLYGKLPNITIMAITGHSTETAFRKYIKTTNNEHANKLKEYWDSDSENKKLTIIKSVKKVI